MSDADAPRRGLRLRWWMWLAAALLIVASLAIGLRVQGFRAFARVQAEIAAAGLPTDPVQLVAGFPAVDADRQQRWLAIERRVRSWPELRAGATVISTVAEQTPDPKAEADAAAFLAAGAADADAIHALLDEGPVVVSLVGFITRDPDTLRHGPIEAFWGPDTVPNLLSMRWLAMHAALRALREPDPAPGLRRLDQLEQALAQPGCLIDEMIRIAILSITNQTRLRLAVRGRLPEATLQAWLARPDPWRLRMADAWAGERCTSWHLYRDVGMSDSPLSWSLANSSTPEWLQPAVARSLWWMLAGWECAAGASQQADIELRVRARPTIGQVAMPLGFAPALSGDSHMQTIQICVEGAYNTRLRQVLAAIATAYRRGVPLPADAAGLDPALAPLLAAGATADEPAIAYERLGPSRLRVGLDPAGPRPPLVPASRWTPDYGTRLGTPPDRAAWVERGRWSLEIDLDAVLVPPPPPKPRPVRAPSKPRPAPAAAP